MCPHHSLVKKEKLSVEEQFPWKMFNQPMVGACRGSGIQEG